MTYYVYSIWYDNRPIYIGSTNNLKKRSNCHKSNCFNEKYNGYQIYEFIRSVCCKDDFCDVITFRQEAIVHGDKELAEKVKFDFIQAVGHVKLLNIQRPTTKGICEHDRRRTQCRECGGGYICEHDRRRNKCKECYPVICEICNKIFSKEYIKRHQKIHLKKN